MIKFFTIGEAAKLVGMTAETLRHYDRIGLVSPHKTDEWTKYRYVGLLSTHILCIANFDFHSNLMKQ